MGAFKYTGADAGKTTRTTPPPGDAERFPNVNADPYVADLSLSAETRASFVADVGRQVDQAIGELAQMARRAKALSEKLLDPALADSPKRPAAVSRSLAMEEEIAEWVRCIVRDEAKADRYWQSLTVQQRVDGGCAAAWGVGATTPRLIGQAWFSLAMRHQWPPGWVLRREWLGHNDMELVLLLDLRLAKVWTWCPNPWPPNVFDGTQAGPTPNSIAAQIADEKGQPR